MRIPADTRFGVAPTVPEQPELPVALGGLLVASPPTQAPPTQYPVDPVSKMRSMGVYVKDAWTIGPRLTANIGVRWDRYNAYVPEQTKVQGQFGGAGTFPEINALTWSRPVPLGGWGPVCCGRRLRCAGGWTCRATTGSFPRKTSFQPRAAWAT